MNKFKRWFGSVKNQAAIAGAAGLGLVSMSAHAAIDTTAVTASLTDAGTASAAVAAAVVVVIVGVKAFKFIRQAL